MTITSYQNPIVRGMYPDPSIVRVDDTFYLVNSTLNTTQESLCQNQKTFLTGQNCLVLLKIIVKLTCARLNLTKAFLPFALLSQRLFYVITTNFAEWKNFIIRGKLSDDKETLSGKIVVSKLIFLELTLTYTLKTIEHMSNLQATLKMVKSHSSN